MESEQHPNEPLLEAILQNQDEHGKSHEQILEAILQKTSENNHEDILSASMVHSVKNTDKIVDALKKPTTIEIEINGADMATYQGGKGEKGDKGDKGDQGERGLKGDKGDQGEKGIDGIDGINGVNGVDGINGTNGIDGINGRDGLDGRDGIDGINGIDGKDGKDGKSVSEDTLKKLQKTFRDAENNLLWVNNGAVKSITAGSNITITGDSQNPTISATGGGTVGPGTANEIAYFDSTTTVNSLATATYPSLTELSYVKGATSAIQTQINAKAPSTAPTFATSITGSYLTASQLLGTDGSKNIVSLATATYPSLTELTYLKGVTSAIQTQLNAKEPAKGSDDNYVTDAQLIVIGNTSGTNTGDQTISDATISTTDITTNNASTTKHGFLKKLSNSATEYMNGAGNWSTPAGGGDMVLASAQTNTGAKTFNTNTLWDKGNTVFNVKAYGAVGDDATNDTSAIQSAIAAAGAVGGVVWFPAGTYRIQTSALLLYTGSTPYSSITLAGAGAGKAIIKQMTTGVDVIKGLNNTTGSVQLLNVTIRDLTVSFGGTTTNSGNGIYLAQVAADGPSFQQMNFKNLILDNFGATGKYGFNAESLIVSSLENVMARSCANGFYLNGGAFGNYDSINTSVTFNNCYANGTNTVLGFNIYRSQYISFNACAADGNTTAAYNINDCSGISFNGCGVEWATGASASAYKFTAAVQCTINGGYIYQGTGTTTNAVYLTSTSTGITATGLAYYQDGGTLTNGFLIDAGSSVTNINCSFSGGTVTNQANINATGVYKTPGTPRRTTETSSATPTINVGKTDVHTITALTTDITSMTTNLTGTAEDGQKLIISITGTASRAITWGASFEASGAVALPTTTSSTARLDVGFIWNAQTSKWRCLASA